MVFHSNNIRRNAKRVTIVAGTAICLLTLAWLFFSASPRTGLSIANSLVLKEKQASLVIGHLGGSPVTIPQAYAHFVEYDGDPHFMEPRKSPPPERTFQSGISSFGFEIRFPDMAVASNKPEAEVQKADIHTTMWMRVGVLSNSTYGSSGDDAFERAVNMIPLSETAPDFKLTKYYFQRIPGKTYGLDGLTPVGADESRRAIGQRGADMRDKNIYFHRGTDGNVDTYIECSNMTHLAARCEQKFNLRPAIRAHVSVDYRKELLPQWKQIQDSVSTVILGFRSNPQSDEKSR